MSSVASPRLIAASLTALWSPCVVAEIDDACIKVTQVHGSPARECFGVSRKGVAALCDQAVYQSRVEGVSR